MLEQEFTVFKKMRTDFLKDHLNEYVIIVGEEVKNFYKTEEEAIQSMKDHELGSFLVKQCIPEAQDIKEYRSRVVFV